MVCVGNDDDLRSVVLGDDGALAGMKAGAVLVDHTTASADVAREIAAHAADKGVGFVDGPVSGGQAGAENGVLTVMCGGSQKDFDTAKPAIMSYARACELLGDVGAASWPRWSTRSALPVWSRAFPKRCSLPSPPVWTDARWWTPFPRVRRSPGRWRIATRP